MSLFFVIFWDSGLGLTPDFVLRKHFWWCSGTIWGPGDRNQIHNRQEKFSIHCSISLQSFILISNVLNHNRITCCNDILFTCLSKNFLSLGHSWWCAGVTPGSGQGTIWDIEIKPWSVRGKTSTYCYIVSSALVLVFYAQPKLKFLNSLYIWNLFA